MVSTRDGIGHLSVRSACGRMQLWFENRRVLSGEPVVFPQRDLVLRAAAPAVNETVVSVVTRRLVH